MKNSWDKTEMVFSLLSVVIAISLILLWQYFSNTNRINSSILPAPTKIWSKFLDTVENGTLKQYVLVSLIRVGKGYLLGGGAGLILGLLLGLSRKFEALMSLFIGLFRPIPAIAWIPVLILAFGIGEGSKVFVIAIGSFWPVLLNTMDGIKGTDQELLELGDVLEKSNWTKISKIMLPAAIPAIFTGARLGISRAWACVVTAEMIAASAGVGYLIQYARELSQPALMLVGVASIGLIGLVIDWMMKKVQTRLLYWNNLN